MKVAALNSTALTVSWKPPSNRDRNGLIRGYQIHVQEMNRHGDLINDALRYDVADENAEERNVTGLQPDTKYSVQVAAVTRKGDGNRSPPKTAHTHGGGGWRRALPPRSATCWDPKRRECRSHFRVVGLEPAARAVTLLYRRASHVLLVVLKLTDIGTTRGEFLIGTVRLFS